MSKHKRLKEIKEEYPILTFNYNGYQFISSDKLVEYNEILVEVDSILKRLIEGYIKFKNFIDCPDGSFDIRVEYLWDDRFKGVGQFNIEEFKND